MTKPKEFLLILALMIATGAALPAQQAACEDGKKPAFPERESWSFEFDNDVFFS